MDHCSHQLSSWNFSVSSSSLQEAADHPRGSQTSLDHGKGMGMNSSEQEVSLQPPELAVAVKYKRLLRGLCLISAVVRGPQEACACSNGVILAQYWSACLACMRLRVPPEHRKNKPTKINKIGLCFLKFVFHGFREPMDLSQTSAKTRFLQRPAFKMFFVGGHVVARSLATKTLTL